LREGPMRGGRAFHFFFGKSRRLPCGSGCYGFGSVGELRDDAELLHKAQERPQLTKPSAILPFETRATVTPEMVMCFPVGAMPLRSPLWVPRQDQRVMTVSPFGNDILDRPNEGRGKQCDREPLLFFSLSGPRPKIGRRRVIVSVIGGKDLVGHRPDCHCSRVR